MRNSEIVVSGACAVQVQVPLTDVQPLAGEAFLTATEKTDAGVVIMTYLVQRNKSKADGGQADDVEDKTFALSALPGPAHPWQEAVVALQQQRAQLGSAQMLQPVLLQDLPVVGRVQRVGEKAPSPAIRTHPAHTKKQVQKQPQQIICKT